MAQLRCENISVGYEDGIVVSDVSFELNRGDYVCIVGENGAGKSSLLKGILGLAKIQGGKLEYGDGMSRADVGYLPQQKDYQKNFPATVKEVVMSGFLNKMGLRPYYNRAEKAKAMEILSDFGMADYVRASFGSLSGGQKQRVLLARAMCATDKLLLLDEPDSALDFSNRHMLMKHIRNIISDNKCALMCIHNPELALEYCDRILLMKDGKIVSDIDVHAASLSEINEKMSFLYSNINVVECDTKGNVHRIVLAL